MTMRKITIDNSVRYNSKMEQTKQGVIESKTRKKTIHFLENKTRTFSPKNKKLNKDYI